MLDTLQKMSGVTHKTFRESKTVTTDTVRIMFKNDTKVTYTLSTKEVPVITYNDMAFLPERNSIVFRASDPPVWNHNATILPMSWRLYKNTIVHAGHEYSLQTIPTLSSALDFDVRKNQPDFTKMLNKRMDQARIAQKAKDAFQKAYGYSEYEIEQLDPDVYSDEIMSIINNFLRKQKEKDEEHTEDAGFDYANDDDWMQYMEDNTEVADEVAKSQAQQDERNRKIYAHGKISKEDLVATGGYINHQFDTDIVSVWKDCRGDFQVDRGLFSFKDGSMYNADGTVAYIVKKDSVQEAHDMDVIQKASQDPEKRTYVEVTDEDVKNGVSYEKGEKNKHAVNIYGSFVVTDDFYRFLVSVPKWDFAHGRFDLGMSREMDK